MKIFNQDGSFAIPAGQEFEYKGFKCRIVRCTKEREGYFDQIEIDGKYFTKSRKNWIKKFV